MGKQNKNTTDKTVDMLVDDLTPARPLLPLWCRGLAWLTATLIFTGWIVLDAGLRYDLNAKLASAGFVFMAVLLLLATLALGVAALWLAVPRLAVSIKVKAALWTGFGAFFAMVGLYMFEMFRAGSLSGLMSTVAHPAQFNCLTDVLLLVTAPLVLIFILLKKGAPTHARLAALSAGAAAGFAALLASLLMCSNDHAQHLLEAHFMPVLVLSVVAAFAGRALLRWS